MATLTTFTAGTPILSADVNANFTAINTEVAGAMRTGYASAVPVGNVGGGTDDLMAWTMPAGTLSAVGDGLVVHAMFEFAANANIKGVLFKMGTGSTYDMNATTTAPNGKDLHVTLTLLVVALTPTSNVFGVGTPILCNNTSGASPAFEAAVSTASSPISVGNLAADMVVKFTGTGVVTNDIRQRLMIISVFKAES
jgi:hypothetical protein